MRSSCSTPQHGTLLNSLTRSPSSSPARIRIRLSAIIAHNGALYLIFSFKLDSTKPEWDLLIFHHVQNVIKFTAFVISCWNRKHTHTVRTHSIHSLVHTNWCKRLDSHPLHTRFAIQSPLHLIHHTSSSIISFVSCQINPLGIQANP